MMIVDRAALQDSDLPMAALAAHMRLPEGWDAVPGQVERLRSRMAAAVLEVEGRVGKSLVLRTFTLSGEALDARVTVPLAPIASVEAVQVDGASVTGFGVEREAHRAVLVLPGVARGAKVVAQVRAGWGTWADAPAPLCEAVLRRAEDLDLGAAAGLATSIRALLAPWRPVRLGARA